MKLLKGKGLAVLVGAGMGAVLMMLATTLTYGFGVGLAGGVLVLLIIAISAVIGWMVGYHNRTFENNRSAYMKGYKAGMEKKTIIIEHPECRWTVRVPDSFKIF